MDLTSTLRDLTSEQPAQPGDRVAAVTRRARRIRRTRTVASLAAVVVLGASLVGVAALRDSKPDTFASTPITDWPDRSYPTDRGVAQGAVAAWGHTELYGASPVSDVHWLFRGRLPLPENTDRYVAVFTATRDGHHWLVASSVPRSQVNADGQDKDRPNDPSVQPWDADVVDLDSQPGVNHVGLYLPYLGTGGVGTEYGAHLNVLFLLAQPGTRAMRWTTHPLAAAPNGSSLEGSTTGGKGIFVTGRIGLTGPVTVEVTGPGSKSTTYPLEIGRSAPSLLIPAEPDTPRGWAATGGFGGAGQTSLQDDGRWTAESLWEGTKGRTGLITGYVRCYGGGSMTFRMVDPNAPISQGRGEVALATGRAACDGHTHQMFRPTPRPVDGFMVTTATDRLQAYRITVSSGAG